MLGNQNNPDGNRLRIYGQNERASSSSSGPKWTSSITDLLVNRSNTMRFNQPQSHQTSQQQLLAQTQGQHASQPNSMHNLHTGVGTAGKGPQTSEGGRLMMKLMNLGAQQQMQQNAHHQPSSSNVSGMGIGIPNSSSTFDHPRLSGSRDDQKRLALDECTNYLQQKTMQQHFPSTSMAISNIINSNRSASSAGIPAGIGAPSSTQASAAAQKFKAFKFNLTMNKQKALSGTAEGPSYSSNAFYQAQMQNEQQEEPAEDTEAMQIHDRQKKQQNNISRGSSQLAMKQHLKQMIKSYEDQPQVHNNVAQDGGDRLHYNETQGIPSSNQDHQHLTYDHSVRKGSAALQGAGATLQPASAKYTGSASSSSKNKPLDRKVHEMEERQKIFEEEIIKRVKEIQSYAKTLHMHLKKIQQTSNKRNEDIQILKEELVQQIKDCHDLVASTNSRGHSTLTDQAVHDLLERRLKLADSEVALQIEHLEQKLVKDFDGKLTRQTRATFNEQQVKNDTLKDEILGIITQEFASNLKSEVMRLVGEKMKEAAKAQDKSIHEIRELVLEKAQQIEDVSTETTNYHKDLNLKQDKLQKAVKDASAHQDQAISSLGDSLRNEIEQVRKRLQSDFKQEIGAMNRNYITQEDLGQELEEFEKKLDKVQLQLQEQAQQQKPLHNTFDQSALNGKLEGLRADLEEQIGQVANELTTRQEQLDQQERQLRSTQEACLQIKSNLASTKAAHDEKVNMLTAKLEDLEMQLEATATRLQQEPPQTAQDPQAILDAIMEQIQPELDNLNDITQQLCQQQESTKQLLHQKIVRSELQEIKQDIDEELKGLQKLIKKQEERVNAVEDGVIGINQVVEGSQTTQMQVQGQIANLEKEIAQSKVINEQKVQQLTHDLQSKTEDLYDELKEMQQQLQALSTNQQPATPRSESTPERKSRLEAMASLRATLEVQISELSQKINNLEGQLQTLSEEQLSEESVIQAINSALSPVQKQVITLQTSSSTQLTSLKGHLDDLSDETHSKLNQHDARLSQLEERHLEHQEASTEKPAQNTSSVHYSAQFEDLHSQFVDLKVQLEETVETVNRQEETIAANQRALEGLKDGFSKNQSKVRDELLEIRQDLSTQRELNACLQDVAVTQEVFTQHKTDLNGQLSKLEAKNQALEKSIEDLKLTITSLQRVPQSPQINEQDIMRQMVAIEARLAQLESVPAGPKIDHGYQSNMLQVSSPIIQQPRRVHQEQSAKLEASHAGHFLEDLSEVISSPNNNNNFANQTQGQDDMLLFNNRSQGSIGRGSVMSNRLANLVSPIGDQGTNHFQFNSQMAGQRLNLDHPQSQEMQVREDEDHKEEVSSQEDPASVQQQELPRSASSKHGQSSSSQSQYEERPDEGGFETESPQKDQAPLDPSSQEDEDDDDQAAIPLQEINISLESAKQDEEEDLQAKASQRVSLLASSQKKSRDEVEEESKHEEGSEDMENQNVEEVLQDLRDAEEDQFDRDEDEESKGENLTPAMNVEGEDESMGVNLMSPEPIQHVPVSQNHHTAPNQLHQANHFVAFESDEEDAQQYDLVPITNTVSRNAAGPHSASQPPQSIPAPGAHQVRNRYYESGSGEDEVDQPLLNNQDEGAENQEFDNFQVDFQDRPNRPSSQVDLAILRLAHSSPLVEEEEKREAEFDDSPFDAASSQRFDQRFEDEGDVRRPITSLARNNRDRELEQQNQDDPDFQAIQHETLSSHRSSELSDRQGFNSRRSISPNLEHQHNNIDPDDPDEEEIKVQALDLEGTLGDADLPYVQHQTSVLLAGCFPGEESKIQVDEQPSDLVEESEPLSQRDEPEQIEDEQDDDWNLEDVTASQRLDNLEEEYDVEEEEKVSQSEGPKLLENQLKSEQVANWIVENELNKCIQALFDLRGYRQQNLKAQNPVFKGGEDLFDVEGSLDWQ